MGGYLVLWLALTAAALVLAIRQRRTLSLFSRNYARFLAVPWRLATFVLATFCLAVIAPRTGDPTWDYYDATLMGLLTFLTAPWVLGTFWRARRPPRSALTLFIAAICWMVSASWSYDLYILLRDGVYPPSALANILASSILYVAAGFFWSLVWRPGRGVTFAFLEADWPAVGPPGGFSRLVGYALAFAVLVTATLGWVFLVHT
jgi:hypothetical protein